MATIDIKAILESLQKERDKKYKSGLNTLQKAMELFGSDYMKGQKTIAKSTMEQSMAGRGLGGSTRPGAISVGMNANFEDARRSGLSNAMTNIGRYIQGGTPTTGDITSLATGGFSGLLGQSQFNTQLAYQKSLINPDWLAM